MPFLIKGIERHKRFPCCSTEKKTHQAFRFQKCARVTQPKVDTKWARKIFHKRAHTSAFLPPLISLVGVLASVMCFFPFLSVALKHCGERENREADKNSLPFTPPVKTKLQQVTFLPCEEVTLSLFSNLFLLLSPWLIQWIYLLILSTLIAVVFLRWRQEPVFCAECSGPRKIVFYNKHAR